jgi:hypothetical protein
MTKCAAKCERCFAQTLIVNTRKQNLPIDWPALPYFMLENTGAFLEAIICLQRGKKTRGYLSTNQKHTNNAEAEIRGSPL